MLTETSSNWVLPALVADLRLEHALILRPHRVSPNGFQVELLDGRISITCNCSEPVVLSHRVNLEEESGEVRRWFRSDPAWLVHLGALEITHLY